MTTATRAGDHAHKLLAYEKCANGASALAWLDRDWLPALEAMIISGLNLLAAAPADGGEERVAVGAHLCPGHQLKVA
jgi:hypothetical protein